MEITGCPIPSQKNPITSRTHAVYAGYVQLSIFRLQDDKKRGAGTEYQKSNNSSRRAWTSAPGIPLLCQPTPPVCKLIYLQQESCRRISPMLQRSSAARRQTYREITISLDLFYRQPGNEPSLSFIGFKSFRPVLAWLYKRCNLLSCFQATVQYVDYNMI